MKTPLRLLIIDKFPANVSAGIVANGRTSGIIVDNAATSPAGTSQVYYSNTPGASAVGNAVQAAQSGL